IVCGAPIGEGCTLETCDEQLGDCSSEAAIDAEQGTACTSADVCVFHETCDGSGNCIGSAPTEGDLTVAYFFTRDGETTIIHSSLDEAPPLTLGNGFYRRYELSYVAADAQNPLAGLPTVGADIAALNTLPEALCSALDVKLVQIDVP